MREHPRRWQISLLNFLLAAVLIGTGVGCYFAGSEYLAGVNAANWSFSRTVLAGLQTLGAGPLIGAGLFAPLRRLRLGAYLGIAVVIVLIDSKSLHGLFVSPGTSVLTAAILSSFLLLLAVSNLLEWLYRRRASRELLIPS